MRVAVVGIGGTGSAAARHLALAGHEVTGYEQFRFGHERGSSHGESRIIRYTYPDPLFTAMMTDAYPLWADLERRAGEELLVRCGGLFFGRHDDPRVAETEQALANAGLSYERLDPRAAEARFPAFRFRADEAALYQSDSGLLRSTRCVLANVRLAREYGATLHEETAVTAIVPHGARAIVRTQAGDEAEYDRVIVTAGAWMGHLFAGLGLPLQVTRQQIVYLQISRHAEQFQPGRFPVWIDATALYYGFPEDGHVPGVKLASHVQGDRVDPDAVDRSVDADYIQETSAYAAQRLSDLSAETTHTRVCLYTNTPNEDFILDHLPGNRNIWLVSGCSGHGFKFTVLLGKIVADLATGGSYARDLSRFRLDRFTDQLFPSPPSP